MRLRSILLPCCLVASMSFAVSCGASIESSAQAAAAAYQSKDTAAYARAVRDFSVAMADRSREMKARRDSGKLTEEQAMAELSAMLEAAAPLLPSTMDKAWQRRYQDEQPDLWKEAKEAEARGTK